ncbi:hypothetical protein TrLO_g11212 [Triparma laevis f. longispina]|uniref:Glutamine synthetase C-terminal domain-containing protein n=1 Tax=Triparma laevis f. longispina TaxID=1714387 RepID=A0A9W7FAY7_9STRA|nr:hypothetical protein TrLO_g11212 [Triparma laevis f. longispina]
MTVSFIPPTFLFADAIEGGADPLKVAQDALADSWKVIFNGDNYDEANQEMLTKNGLWRIDSTVEANHRMVDPKNIALFSEMGVL